MIQAVFSENIIVPSTDLFAIGPVNKYGRSTNVDTAVTDIWDRANATADQKIWLAPTEPRIHTIQSDSVNDVTDGTGIDRVLVFYLKDWDSKQAVELVGGDLNTGIAMNTAAVMIHRMKTIIQDTSTTVNAGTITATAAGDATVTAQINPGEGQTQMAIYGIPSTQNVYMSNFYASVLRANLGVNEAHIDSTLLYCEDPKTNATLFTTKHTLGIGSRGDNPSQHDFNPYRVFEGPGILKMQGIGSANNLDVSAGFDLYIKDKNGSPLVV